MGKSNNINVTKVNWSYPMSLVSLSKIYNVHRNTMSKWLKGQIICNRQLSPRRWQVAIYDLPNGYQKLEKDESV